MKAAVAALAVVAFVLALAAGAPPARAEDVAAYEVEGQADAAGADPRIAALDDAFAHAAAHALEELVPAAARKARKTDLDREIVGRARLWVVKFSVAKDATEDGRRQLAVSVRIDRDKMRGRLAELGLAGPATDGSNGDGSAAVAAASDPHSPGARSVTVLLRVSRPDSFAADYGSAAVPDAPGVAALSAAMRAAGFGVKRAPSTGAPALFGGDLPLDDGEADMLATAAGAELALIGGVTIGPRQPIRGVPGDAALVTAHLRLVERGSHQLLGEGIAAVAATGATDDEAVVRAVTAAAADSVPAPPHVARALPQFRGDDTAVAEPGVVLVHMPPSTPFGIVEAEAKFLAGAKGVRSATIRRLSPGGWTLGVATGETVERVAQLARKPPASDTSVAVKVVGEVVELQLSGSP